MTMIEDNTFSHDAHTSSKNQPYVYEGVPSYYHADRKKIRVQLKIRQIKKHVSHFDFDDEYEEI